MPKLGALLTATITDEVTLMPRIGRCPREDLPIDPHGDIYTILKLPHSIHLTIQSIRRRPSDNGDLICEPDPF
jgi:hypothetical protein